MFNLIDDCGHPLLYLPSTGIASYSYNRVLSAKSCWQWCQHLEADYGMDPWVWQSLDGPSFHLSSNLCLWITEPPMEELENVPKELKGSSTLQVEQQYELTSTPRACSSSCICSRRWPSQPSRGRESPWYHKLYMPPFRGMPGPKSGNG